MLASQTTQWLRELVQIPSVNPGGASRLDPQIHGESRVTDWLESRARTRGIRSYRQPVASGRDNLIMEVQGRGENHRTQLWEVHQDTVDVAGMTVEPFGARIQDGRLYGRGACDVKGSMAAMLGALAEIHQYSGPVSDRIILACTVDEEHTFLGVQALRAHSPGRIWISTENTCRPDFAIVAEPSSLGIIEAHKGVIRWHIRVHGTACHSSTPDLGSNAIYAAAEIAKAIEKLQIRLRESSKDHLGGGSICLTQISGGSAPNIVPHECVLLIDRRIGFTETPEEAGQQLQAVLDGLGFPSGIQCQLSQPIIRCPALMSNGNGPAIRSLGTAIRKTTGQCEVRSVAFGTDASTIAEHGIPAVVFGPGDIAQAHTKDEWIDLRELETAARILFLLATKSSSSGLETEA